MPEVTQEVTQGHRGEDSNGKKKRQLYLSIIYPFFLLKVQISLLFFPSACKPVQVSTF